MHSRKNHQFLLHQKKNTFVSKSRMTVFLTFLSPLCWALCVKWPTPSTTLIWCFLLPITSQNVWHTKRTMKRWPWKKRGQKRQINSLTIFFMLYWQFLFWREELKNYILDCIQVQFCLEKKKKEASWSRKVFCLLSILIWWSKELFYLTFV